MICTHVHSTPDRESNTCPRSTLVSTATSFWMFRRNRNFTNRSWYHSLSETNERGFLFSISFFGFYFHSFIRFDLFVDVYIQSNPNCLWCTRLLRWANIFERRWLRRSVTRHPPCRNCVVRSLLDALRILLRCLKYESERKDARLQMLDSKIIENDLIPILIHLEIKHDKKIIHHALK